MDYEVPFALKLLLAFGLSAVADATWTRWMMSVHAKNPMGAGFWSSSIMLIGTINMLLIVHNYSLIPAEVAGAFVGAYWAVKSKNAPNVTQE